MEEHTIAEENTLEDNQMEEECSKVSEETTEIENALQSSPEELSDQEKVVPAVSSIEVEQLSDEEQQFMLKVFRAILANEQLIDIFCEKVISKIAARNKFCGPDCGHGCGGLNSLPAEANDC